MSPKIQIVVLSITLLTLGACGGAVEYDTFDSSQSKALQPVIVEMDPTEPIVAEIPLEDDVPEAGLCDSFDLTLRIGVKMCLEAMIADGRFVIPGVSSAEAVAALMEMGASQAISESVVMNNLALLGIEASTVRMTESEFESWCIRKNGGFPANDGGERTCDYNMTDSSGQYCGTASWVSSSVDVVFVPHSC